MGLTNFLGDGGKVTLDINFILSPYYRSWSIDKDFLHELLLNSRFLCAVT